MMIILVIGMLVVFSTPQTIQVKPQSTSTDLPSPQVAPVSTDSREEYTKIKQLAQQQGVAAAWTYVSTTYAKQNTGSSEAHDLAHYAGKLIFEKNGLEGMTICTPDLAFGCYHGLLDVAFKKDLSKLNEAQEACEKLGDRGSGPVASCTHGIGHGVASYFKSTDLKAALKICDSLPENSPQYCYDGVFMEFSRDTLDSFYHPNDPLYPCNAIDKEYVYACGRNLPAVLIDRFQRSFEDVAKICEKSKNSNLASSCYTALGFQAARSSTESIDKVIKLCETLSDKNFQYQCKSAAAGDLIFQNIAGWKIDSPAICDTLSEPQASACLSHINRIMTTYQR